MAGRGRRPGCDRREGSGDTHSRPPFAIAREGQRQGAVGGRTRLLAEAVWENTPGPFYLARRPRGGGVGDSASRRDDAARQLGRRAGMDRVGGCNAVSAGAESRRGETAARLFDR